jgi:predicted amidophosphoribosyltransferase
MSQIRQFANLPEPAKPKVKTPSCPGCGAKFSHDKNAERCKRCGIPDAVVDMGPQAVARWQRQSRVVLEGGELVELTKSQYKTHRTLSRQKRRKHGRNR